MGSNSQIPLTPKDCVQVWTDHDVTIGIHFSYFLQNQNVLKAQHEILLGKLQLDLHDVPFYLARFFAKQAMDQSRIWMLDTSYWSKNVGISQFFNIDGRQSPIQSSWLLKKWWQNLLFNEAMIAFKGPSSLQKKGYMPEKTYKSRKKRHGCESDSSNGSLVCKMERIMELRKWV